jgi:hypothetical protein
MILEPIRRSVPPVTTIFWWDMRARISKSGRL